MGGLKSTYRAKCAKRDIRAEEEVLLTAYIAGTEAATGPLASWNRFDWLRRHLRADVPLDVVAKPAKKGRPDSKISQNDQAVAMPPEFLMAFETALERMVDERDWRCNPLAELKNEVKQLREQLAVLKQGCRDTTPSGREGKGGKDGKGGKGKSARDKAKGRPVTVDKMHNGTKLCEAFSKGQCPKDRCKKNPPERHSCNGKLPGRRGACAQPHMSIKCPRCERV